MNKKEKPIKKRFKKLNSKPAPLLFILVLLLIVPILSSSVQTKMSDNQSRVGTVTIRGEEVFRVALNSDTPHQEVTFYPTKEDYAVVEVKGFSIRIKEDSTASKFAVNKGWISNPGDTTVSLEHGLLIKVFENGSDLKDKIQDEKNPQYPF